MKAKADQVTLAEKNLGAPSNGGSPKITENEDSPSLKNSIGFKSPIGNGHKKSILKRNVNIDENYLKTPLLLKESDMFFD